VKVRWVGCPRWAQPDLPSNLIILLCKKREGVGFDHMTSSVTNGFVTTPPNGVLEKVLGW